MQTERMLTEARKNVAVVVTAVEAEERTRRHLENIGILPGQEVRVMGENAGNLILRVLGARLALSSGLASTIMVREECDGKAIERL